MHPSHRDPRRVIETQRKPFGQQACRKRGVLADVIRIEPNVHVRQPRPPPDQARTCIQKVLHLEVVSNGVRQKRLVTAHRRDIELALQRLPLTLEFHKVLQIEGFITNHQSPLPLTLSGTGRLEEAQDVPEHHRERLYGSEQRLEKRLHACAFQRFLN